MHRTARSSLSPAPDRGAARQSGGTSHAERVFRVQQAFAQLGGGEQGLAELARVSDVDDSAVHRILRSGVDHGTFLQVGRGRYRLGPQAARLGVEALEQAVDNVAVRRCLERLRCTVEGGLVFLYSLTHFGGTQRQCVEMAVGSSDLSELGMTPRDLMSSHRSLRVGASGRVLTAYLPESVRRRVLAGPVPRGTGPGVCRDPRAWAASLVEVRAKGYAIAREECAAGWDSFAAPVFWGDLVVGAVSLLVRRPVGGGSCVPAVLAAADEIQRMVTAPGAHGSAAAKSA